MARPHFKLVLTPEQRRDLETRFRDSTRVKERARLQAVPQSRRLLESRFRRLLGRTPHEEILRVQMDRVKQLLVETDLPLAEVAERASFAHVEYLSVVFKRETGIPPSAFRRANR